MFRKWLQYNCLHLDGVIQTHLMLQVFLLYAPNQYIFSPSVLLPTTPV